MLDPEAASLVKGTFLEHMVFQAAPDELPSTIRYVLGGAQRRDDGELIGAEKSMRLAVDSNPGSRIAHAGLGTVLLERYAVTGSQSLVDEGVTELTQADRLGAKAGQVFFPYTIGRAAAEMSDRSRFDLYFNEIDAQFPSYQTLLGKGVGLRLLGDPGAERVLALAHAARSYGETDAASELGIYLIGKGRFDEALGVLSPPSLRPDEPTPFVHLVRGVAYESRGDLNEASAEYAEYVPMARVFPVPQELRIKDSVAQRPLFPLAGASHHSESDVLVLLAKIVEGESASESPGGKRAVAWTVRTRVFKGAVACCLTPISNSGSTREDKYWNVMNQSGQFNPAPGYSPDSANAAFQVYGGAVPDPLTGGCIAGSRSGTPCDGTCSGTNKDGAFVNGPRSFYSTTGPCGSQFSCMRQGGKTCGNGGSDHCFSYSNCQDCCSGSCPC
ncbi:MAG: hypothetical protein HYX50_02970 [Chloroflexi bacterium]|nr:hypothetical protein [Chloroflexota bacterium]